MLHVSLTQSHFLGVSPSSKLKEAFRKHSRLPKRRVYFLIYTADKVQKKKTVSLRQKFQWQNLKERDKLEYSVGEG